MSKNKLLILVYLLLILLIITWIIRKNWKKKKLLPDYSIYEKSSPQQGAEIPKKVHQIWIGRDMPEYRKELTDRVKQWCKDNDFEYILWDNSILIPGNENFYLIKEFWPVLYRVLKKKYIVWAKVSDILRYILLYKLGGIYLDTTFEIVSPERFREIYTENKDKNFIYSHERDSISDNLSNSFFMCKQYSLNLYSVLRNLNNINIKGKANEVTGPFLFIKALENRDNTYRIDKMDIYPYYPWEKHRAKNPCYFKNLQGNQDQDSLIKYIEFSNYGKKQYIQIPCKKYNSILLDHFTGGTWIKKTINYRDKPIKVLLYDHNLFFKKKNYYFLWEFFTRFLLDGWTLLPLHYLKKSETHRDAVYRIYNTRNIERVLIFLTSAMNIVPKQLYHTTDLLIEDMHFDSDIAKLRMIYPYIRKIYSRYPNIYTLDFINSENVIVFSHYPSPLCYEFTDTDKIEKLLVVGATSQVYKLRDFAIKKLDKSLYHQRTFSGYSTDGDAYREYTDYCRDLSRYSIILCDTGLTRNINRPYILCKVYETAACGSLILTHRAVIEEMRLAGFIENEHYIACDENSLEETVRYWLSPENKDRLMDIAKKASDLVKERYNLEKIYKKIENK